MRLNIISVDIADNNGVHLSKSAWKYSRLLDDKANLVDILKLDLPVNEMPSAVIKIDCTVLEREVITTTRSHSIWARSSRVDSVLDFTVKSEFYNKYTKFYEGIRSDMVNKSDSSRQDEYRNNLPLVSNCQFTARINMRQAVKFLNTFIALSELSPNAKLLFDSAITAFTGLLKYSFGVDTDAATKLGKRFLIHEIKNVDDGIIGDVLSINTYIPFYLRAQLVRHRELIIADDFINIIKHDLMPHLTFNTMIRVQVAAHINDWFNIVSKRNCWMAHYDLWAPLLNKVEKFCNFKESALPCHGVKCPYIEDVRLRKIGEGPGSACPVEINLDDGKVSLENRDKMLTQYAEEQRPEFWMDQIVKLEIV